MTAIDWSEPVPVYGRLVPNPRTRSAVQAPFPGMLQADAKQIQLLIVPKFAKDQEDFKQAEVWLDREKLLPNRLYFVEHNGNRVTFEFKGIWQNIEYWLRGKAAQQTTLPADMLIIVE